MPTLYLPWALILNPGVRIGFLLLWDSMGLMAIKWIVFPWKMLAINNSTPRNMENGLFLTIFDGILQMKRTLTWNFLLADLNPLNLLCSQTWSRWITPQQHCWVISTIQRLWEVITQKLRIIFIIYICVIKDWKTHYFTDSLLPKIILQQKLGVFTILQMSSHPWISFKRFENITKFDFITKVLLVKFVGSHLSTHLLLIFLMICRLVIQKVGNRHLGGWV